MAFWFYRGLRRGIATTRYPKTIDAWAQALPTAPAFHSTRLTTTIARRLVAICAAGALTTDGRELVLDLGRCTACGQCIELGDGVAEPNGEFLLATADAGALIKRVAIGGDRGARDDDR